MTTRRSNLPRWKAAAPCTVGGQVRTPANQHTRTEDVDASYMKTRRWTGGPPREGERFGGSCLGTVCERWPLLKYREAVLTIDHIASLIISYNQKWDRHTCLGRLETLRRHDIQVRLTRAVALGISEVRGAIHVGRDASSKVAQFK